MVYLKLLTNKIDELIDFYAQKLGLFDLVGDRRLVCKNGVALIIDLRESNEVSTLGIGIRFEELMILEKLKESNIDYKIEENLAGQHLYLNDPNDNQLWITTLSGNIT